MYYPNNTKHKMLVIRDGVNGVAVGCGAFLVCQIFVLPMTQLHETLAILLFLVSGLCSSFMAARLQKSGVLVMGIFLGLIYGPLWNLIYLIYLKHQYLFLIFLGVTKSDLVFTRMWQNYTATSTAILVASMAGCIIYSLSRAPLK